MISRGMTNGLASVYQYFITIHVVPEKHNLFSDGCSALYKDIKTSHLTHI